MKYLLDTHVLLHYAGQSPQLKPEHDAIIEAATAQTPLYLSDMSLWEIATLQSLGRIRISALQEWLEQVTSPPLVERVRLTPAVAAEVAALPDSFHRDSGDRVIVASARVLGATLLTQDDKIIEAGIVKTL